MLLACARPYSQAQTASRYDLVIDEILADPSPPAGLPASEFIEIRNMSGQSFNLRNWKISDQSTTASIRTDFILQPDSFVVLCSSSAATAYANFGPSVGVTGFPSLDNEGDLIMLHSPEGVLVHAVAYQSGWYRNNLKKEGGWTLEMIDCKNPCGGADNWQASISDRGGTPGTINSVNGSRPDESLPSLLRTYTIDSMTIVAVFDEPLDSLTASAADHYQLNNEIGMPVSASLLPPLFNEVRLVLGTSLKPETVYELLALNFFDCAGNPAGPRHTAKVALPGRAERMDLVINEILFNPKADGYDYVEFYNRSNKAIDLGDLFIAKRDAVNGIVSQQTLSTGPRLLFPGEYAVTTENSQWLQEEFLVKQPGQILQLAGLPSMPDDHGNILLADRQGNILDELQYDHSWHFALLNAEEGVALERMDYRKATQDPTNWTSAASTSGYGTPTYQNSQFITAVAGAGTVSIQPKIFSPDNDGYDDYCLIRYQLPMPGYVASITLFDIAGKPVRYLLQNRILGQEGNFRWDGLGEKQKKLPVGIYVVLTELFNLEGDSKRIMNTVTLARKFE
ncbi:MAG TPA: lamin tail domain-containing protein [Puia sp.]|nr:lamin tail domain-containing protein [Puia sp.]